METVQLKIDARKSYVEFHNVSFSSGNNKATLNQISNFAE